MSPSTHAPLGALLLLAGGMITAVGSLLPWARISVISITGTSTTWGGVTLATGVLGGAPGFLLVRGYRPATWARLLVLVAAATAVAISSVVNGSVNRSILEDRLDAHLAPHGLSASDVLRGDGSFTLFNPDNRNLDGDTVQTFQNIENSLTVRPDLGLRVTLTGGLAMSLGALATVGRRRGRAKGVTEAGDRAAHDDMSEADSSSAVGVQTLWPS